MSTATASPSCVVPRLAEDSRALAAVRQLLKGCGVRSYAVQTIGLKLSGPDGRPIAYGRPDLHSPELIVHEGDGSVVATVTIGPRSGCYLVTLRNGVGLQKARKPQHVADLILTAQPGGHA